MKRIPNDISVAEVAAHAETACQHPTNEDCLRCAICGRCSESVNLQDICADCWKRPFETQITRHHNSHVGALAASSDHSSLTVVARELYLALAALMANTLPPDSHSAVGPGSITDSWARAKAALRQADLYRYPKSGA